MKEIYEYTGDRYFDFEESSRLGVIYENPNIRSTHMAGGANGGPGTEGKAFDAGPVGVNLADPQGTAEGLAQAQEAQNAFDAALEAELKASPFSSLQEMAEFEQ